MSLIIIVLALSATAMITATLKLTTGAATLQRRALVREQAVFLADAGLEHALINLKNDSSWRTGFTNKALGAGTYTVSLTDSGSTILIVSTGDVNGTQGVLNASVTWE